MMPLDSNRLWAAEADIRAVFVGEGFSLLSAENNYRIGRYCEFVGRYGLTD